MSQNKSYSSTTMRGEIKPKGSSSVALTAVALQDHWSRTLALGTNFGPKKVGLGAAARAKQKREIKSMIDNGRNRGHKKSVESHAEEKEYVLDEKPKPLTLAQKFGLVHAPKPLLSEEEWSGVKSKSNQRNDSGEPCVICKEDFGLQGQVLLSCTHVFHKACLQAFERFTGRKTCPMCRHEQYQTRVIHEGARFHKHKSATIIQSFWRGYVVRSWYVQLRETVPPKDLTLKKKFYEKKLSSIVDRMIRSVDVNISEFMRELDSSVEKSRAVFSQWDAIHCQLTSEEWEAIQLKAVERGDVDCPICLTELHSHNDDETSETPNKDGDENSKSKSEKSAPKKNSSTHAARRKLEDKNLLKKISQKQEGLQGAENGVQTAVKDSGKDSSCTRIHEDEQLQCSEKRVTSVRSTVLLSCTHVFHSTCLQTLEEIAMFDMKNTCPVCRSHYQKKNIAF